MLCGHLSQPPREDGPRGVQTARWPPRIVQTNVSCHRSKCAKDPVHSAAGQTVMASAWEHSEALFALPGQLQPQSVTLWWPGGSPQKSSMNLCKANHSNSGFLSSSHMWYMSQGALAMQDEFWLAVWRLRNLSIHYKCD